jgi:hypothetical protein
MKKLSATVLLIAFVSLTFYAQNRSIETQKISHDEIIIDGILNEQIWNTLESADKFTQWQPVQGEHEKNRTIVHIAYSETSLYIGAAMYVDEKIEVYEQLTERDDHGLADYFVFVFDPFGDNAMSYNFGVTAAGVQFDYKRSENGIDVNWNEVWKSKIYVDDMFWSAEFEIPYSAIRFPKENRSERKINFIRYISDDRRSLAWSPVDRTEGNMNISNGILKGFTIDKTPVRLSLSPYIAGYIEKRPENDKLMYYVKGGADLKYGINESFTLDMMLIPDFGQVRSDDYNLNLSPYEIYYDERRSFFTEGTELFERTDIFYSRRIGGTPMNYGNLEDQLNEHETIQSNPSELQLLNATKISGKTKGGTSIGFLNAISLRSKAEITDTIDQSSRILNTQEITNYNVTAFEQSLKNNSYISLINTNMLIPESNFMANVTGTEYKFAEKTNTYAIFGRAAYSHNNLNAEISESGYLNEISFEKIKGNFKFELENQIINHTFNPNYMGFLQRNNEIESEAQGNYIFYNPFKKVIHWHFLLRYGHNMYFKPRHILSSEINFHTCMLLRSRIHMYFDAGGELGDMYNFDETRTEGRYFRQQRTNYIISGFSTDYAKLLALDFRVEYWRNIDQIQRGYSIRFAPRLQPTNSFTLILSSAYADNINYGFTGIEENDIQFGLRLRKDIKNIIDAQYIFNNKSSISLRISHQYSSVDYDGSFLLDNQGFPQPAEFEIDPIDYNMLNSYLIYNLEFAPGSFLSLTWKYEILNSEDKITDNYFSALRNTLQEDPYNNVSLRLIFYLNYFSLKNKLLN